MSSQTMAYFQSVIVKSKELTRKEKDIILKRLQKKPLRIIARKYKVTGERIRQIENEALKKFLKKICQLVLIE
jgi:DNA-directed RNA polymerase sigma subunit (sigma70/sigma32)